MRSKQTIQQVSIQDIRGTLHPSSHEEDNMRGTSHPSSHEEDNLRGTSHPSSLEEDEHSIHEEESQHNPISELGIYIHGEEDTSQLSAVNISQTVVSEQPQSPKTLREAFKQKNGK